MLSVFLALFWLPVTAHCEWANLPGLEAFRCEAAAHESTDAESQAPGHGHNRGHGRDTGCCSVESSAFLSSAARAEATVPIHPVDLDAAPFCGSSPSRLTIVVRSQVELPAVAPPRIPPWQFRFRAALLPRAPSFAF